MTPSAPGLLNEELVKGQLDAAMQFPDVSFPAEAAGNLKQATSLPAILKDGGFDSSSFYLSYNLADAWSQAHPGAAPKLIAAMNDAVGIMESDDSVWPALAKVEGLTDTSVVPAFMRMQRAAFTTSFSRNEIQPTQALFDAILKVISRDDLGATQVDPAAVRLRLERGCSESSSS